MESNKLVDKILDELHEKWSIKDIKLSKKGIAGRIATAVEKRKKIMAALGEGNEYQEYFKSMLAKHGIKSPNQLDDAKKKVFFDQVKKGWASKKS